MTATPSIGAIQTIYRGHRFRSRLEARWAIFFDLLDLPYRYEAETYALPGLGWYLPDFWLPTLTRGAGAFVEIKPDVNALAEIKLTELGKLTTERCLLLAGDPWPFEFRGVEVARSLVECQWYRCPRCQATDLLASTDPTTALCDCWKGWPIDAVSDFRFTPTSENPYGSALAGPELVRAFAAARGFRFDRTWE